MIAQERVFTSPIWVYALALSISPPGQQSNTTWSFVTHGDFCDSAERAHHDLRRIEVHLDLARGIRLVY